VEAGELAVVELVPAGAGSPGTLLRGDVARQLARADILATELAGVDDELLVSARGALPAGPRSPGRA
jgi:hypothetical protein